MSSSIVTKGKSDRIELPKAFAGRVAEKRRQKGLSQAQLATLVVVTQASISQIESGERKQVKAHIVYALADSLDTTVGYLMSGEENTAEKNRKVSPQLRRIADRIADRSEEEQKELIEAIEWLIDWRYGA